MDKEVVNEILVPCFNGDEVLFKVKVQYVTKGDQLLRLNSSSLEDPSQFRKISSKEIIEAEMNTMLIMAAQSEHAVRQWQRLKNDNEDIMNKVSALIEQGIITKEQFDNALNNSKVK